LRALVTFWQPPPRHPGVAAWQQQRRRGKEAKEKNDGAPPKVAPFPGQTYSPYAANLPRQKMAPFMALFSLKQ
jgi:hypothetical protein